MRLGIMQPYFFPYLGYFSLIKHTERFILFDSVQFIRHGWIERNRVLKQNGGWVYIKVPVSNKGRETLIKELEIDNSQVWQDKILAQIQHYKKLTPLYFRVRNLLGDLLSTKQHSVVNLNKHLLTGICNYIGINKELHVYSELNLNIETPNAPDEWALNICKSLGGVTEYWNPPGGISFFDRNKYNDAGIKLLFHSAKLIPYRQGDTVFEPGLSIVDVLMFNEIDVINHMLDQYEFL